MDSQHRHELGENELAAWLANAIEKVKPYATLIVISVAGLALVSVAWGFYRSSSTQERASSWDMYTVSMHEGSPNLGALERAAEDLGSDGDVANWAGITWADGRLFEASMYLLHEREKANTAIKEARDKYESLLLAKGVTDIVRSRAQFGLARSYEIQGDLAKAIEGYGEVTGAFKKEAEDRVKTLNEPSAKEDIEWLKTAQAPRVQAPFGPGMPGQSPDFSPDSLDDPLEEAPDSGDTFGDILKSYDKESQADGNAEAMDPKDGEPKEGEPKPSADEKEAAEPANAKETEVAPPETPKAEEPKAEAASSSPPADNPAETAPPQ